MAQCSSKAGLDTGLKQLTRDNSCLFSLAYQEQVLRCWIEPCNFQANTTIPNKDQIYVWSAIAKNYKLKMYVFINKNVFINK